MRIKDKVIKTIATACFIGYSPFAPGTMGSLVGLFIYLLVKDHHNIYYMVTACTLLVGFYVANKAIGIFGKNDPREVVIDEVAGMLIVYLFLPFSFNILIWGFLIFRLIDVLKVPPIRRLERLAGGYGIMLDDVAAATLTNILLRIVLILGVK